MLKSIIDNPVLATVISIIIVILGGIGLATLPVEQYPDIAPPTVKVEANYTGANADVVMNSVIIPIEEAINGVEGMTYMTSSASNSGTAEITVYFRQGIDPDIAAVNVQNRISKATPLLPQEVTQEGVTVQKQQSSMIMIINLSSENPEHDPMFIHNYANINLLPQIKRVYGVGNAQLWGMNDYSMRIWLQPDKMASYKINPSEVIAALRDQNIEAAPGELGKNGNQSFQYTLKYTGRLKEVKAFEDIVVRSEGGLILRIKDIANVELGALDYALNQKIDGKKAASFFINQAAGSNAKELIENVKAVVEEAQKTMPPGIKVSYLMDSSEFLDASIHKVVTTLFEAFILVFIVVFIFLQDIRSTIIPAIAVPVAIIGTFFFLQLFGFSINLLTLFALVLAVGIVVDDAIVVVEAVHAQFDNGEKNARKATIAAMQEIAPAIVSITLVMSSVFIPVSLIGGTTGIFFKQFGLTLAVAIIISAVNALTLSPALCALLLKGHKDPEIGNKSFFKRFFYSFNIAFNTGTSKYKSALHFLGKKGHRWITVVIIFISTVTLFGLMKFLPIDFVPQEDSDGVMGMISMSPGTSLERTDSIMQHVVQIANEIEDIEAMQDLSGINFMSGVGSSYGAMVIKMKPWDQRKLSTNDVVAILTEKTQHIKDANGLFFSNPTLQGFGLSSGVELQLQDKTGGDINKFTGITGEFLDAMRQRKEVMVAMTNFNSNFPQKQIEANIPKIREAGLTLNEVMQTMQAYVGSMYISNFNLYGKQFRVMVQAAPEYRAKLNDLNGLSIRTASGEMAPITEFVDIKDVTGPQNLTRFNMFMSNDVTIIPNFMEGYSAGDVIQAVTEVSGQILPIGYAYEYSGLTREAVSSSNQTVIIFILSLVFVYLLLSALYRSYIIPLAVILSLPVGLAGVYIFLMIFGLHIGIVNNIYVQISLIMLIGLLAKNAILIVEYAIQRRRQGMGVIDAAVNGAVARLRPILMTSFAFIAGLLPLMFATGAGAIGNRSIGISAVGGMLIGTILGILVIPSLYIIFQLIQDKFTQSGLLNTEKEDSEE
ncbi:MAG: efflux RND transporter permease subunit [Prevotella sp.]|jgi:HAE1 family hydrophobic/amphiphilic exporter-1|nr:efflux RND transporter permease subunit [Prevotella sp.]